MLIPFKKLEYHTIRCPVCTSDDFEQILKSKLPLSTYKINISICKSCGHIYQNPKLSNADEYKFNKDFYGYFYGSKKDSETEKEYKFILDRTKEYLPSEKISILDVGAGTGIGLKSLSKYLDAELSAIESQETVIQNYSSMGISLVSTDFNNIKNIDLKFDLIILRHTLEHSVNPESLIIDLKHLMNSDTVLYIAVPNLQAACSPIRFNFFILPHLQYFSHDHLSHLLSKHLKIINSQPGDQLCKGEMWFLLKRDVGKKIDLKNFYFQNSIHFKSILRQESKVSNLMVYLKKIMFVVYKFASHHLKRTNKR